MIRFDIDDHGLLRRHLRPLICLVVYGTDAHFACLNLLLESLIDFGKYVGEVAIFSDRDKDDVLKFIPIAMKPRTLHFPLRDSSLMGRYTIADSDLSQYCPILYLDNDIIVDTDIACHLARIATQEGICVTTEKDTYSEFSSHRIAEINDDRRIGNWFGLDLLRADPECCQEFLPVANSGMLGFKDPEQFFLVSNLIRNLYRHPIHANLAKYFTDQPFLNYVLVKTRLGSYETLQNACSFLGLSERFPDQERGFAHFIWARDHDKIWRMEAYLHTLRQREQALTPVSLDTTVP